MLNLMCLAVLLGVYSKWREVASLPNPGVDPENLKGLFKAQNTVSCEGMLPPKF